MHKLLKILSEVVKANPTSQLMRSLYQALGNKRYLHDVEIILERLELTAAEENTLQMLSRDIANLHQEASRKDSHFKKW